MPVRCINFRNQSCEIVRLIELGYTIVNPKDIDKNCDGWKSSNQCPWYKPDFRFSGALHEYD